MARDMMLTVDEYMALRRLLDSEKESEGARLADRMENDQKPKRKPSAYNKRFAKAYNDIKKKRPRTKHVNIMKQAHKVARRKK